MILYYSIAKEGKYKKDNDGNYIDCGLAISKGYISHVSDEKDRIAEANKMKSWVSSQIEVPEFFIMAITKEKFDSIEEK